MRKLLLSLIGIILLTGTSFAKDVPVKITPSKLIRTSDMNLQEGDYLEFKVVEGNETVKKDAIVTGLITSLEHNGYEGKTAKLYIENFASETDKKEKIKLKGVIYLEGDRHDQVMEFTDCIPYMYIVAPFVRGGEVKIRPEKDTFTLFLEE